VGSTAKTGTVATDSSVAANIGRSPSGGSYWGGMIDDVRLFNRALTVSEIGDLASGVVSVTTGTATTSQRASTTHSANGSGSATTATAISGSTTKPDTLISASYSTRISVVVSLITCFLCILAN
jgi:hypothetical protein